MARNVAKDDLEAQREALSGHGYFAYSSSGSKTPWTTWERARFRRAVARAVRTPRPSRISKARTPTAPAMVLVAYPADRKPFPVESGIWLTRDYAATS